MNQSDCAESEKALSLENPVELLTAYVEYSIQSSANEEDEWLNESIAQRLWNKYNHAVDYEIDRRNGRTRPLENLIDGKGDFEGRGIATVIDSIPATHNALRGKIEYNFAESLANKISYSDEAIRFYQQATLHQPADKRFWAEDHWIDTIGKIGGEGYHADFKGIIPHCELAYKHMSSEGTKYRVGELWLKSLHKAMGTSSCEVMGKFDLCGAVNTACAQLQDPLQKAEATILKIKLTRAELNYQRLFHPTSIKLGEDSPINYSALNQAVELLSAQAQLEGNDLIPTNS